jgi:hypothetical protein
MSSELPADRPGLGRRVGRQVLTVVVAVLTLAYGAAMTWASLASPREPAVPSMPGNGGMINDVPANLTWLMLVGIAIVAWRQIVIGLLTSLGAAALVLTIAFVETDRYAAAGQSGTVHLLIYLIAAIQAGSFIIVGIATGLFGWQQRVKLRQAHSAR